MLIARWALVHNLPSPLPLDADPALFSESRAMAHATALATDIGPRVVGTPAIELAETYVSDAADAVAAFARATRDRHDLDVDVVSHRPSGSFRLNFLNSDIANAYTNLTNVAIRIARRGSSLDTPSVLLSAHFDTTLGSPGAADCASCVGVLLEHARALVAANAAGSGEPPAAPLVFLFNGGEESFMQAAHGFVDQHPWAPSIGVVINVEATGSHGPDVLFRETGGWPAASYARAAPRFAATSTVRDLVRFVSLPVDTDFSVFADPTLRNLPGVDIASMLGGTTYHTDKDVVSRVREGSVQAYGENVAKGADAVARALLKRTGGRRHDPRAEPATRAGESGAFFDVYFLEGFAIDSRGASALLHAAPLLACIVDFALGGASRRASYASGVRVSAKSFALTLAAPALLGAARAVVSGKPLAWFGRPALAAALFAPPALVATLLPYADAQLKHGPIARLDGARGATLFASALAALLGLANAAVATQFAAHAFSAAIVVFALPARLAERAPFVTLALLSPGVALAAPVAAVTTTLISEKVGIAGSEPWPLGLPLGDLVMGLAVGFSVHLVGMTVAPFAAVATKAEGRKMTRLLALAWLVAALVASVAVGSPYTAQNPKRLAALHQHEPVSFATTAGGGAFMRSEVFVGAFDAVPAASAMSRLHASAATRATTRRDFAAMHPVNQLVGEGVAFAGVPEAAAPPWGATVPTLRIERVVDDDGTSNEGVSPRGVARLAIVFRSRAPAWSCARVAGPILAWSLSPTLPAPAWDFGSALREFFTRGRGGKSDAEEVRWARHAGNGAAAETWRFWVEVAEEDVAAVAVDAWALFTGETREIRDVLGETGEEISIIAATTFKTPTATVMNAKDEGVEESPETHEGDAADDGTPGGDGEL